MMYFQVKSAELDKIRMHMAQFATAEITIQPISALP